METEMANESEDETDELSTNHQFSASAFAAMFAGGVILLIMFTS